MVYLIIANYVRRLLSMATMVSDTAAILVCAGNATRMGGINKILLPLGTMPVVGYSLLAFEKAEEIAQIVVVTRADCIEEIQDIAHSLGIQKLVAVVEGGATRQESVWAGIRSLDRKDISYLAIHDGARPLVTGEQIRAVIHDAHVFGGATLGCPVKDTIKYVDDGLITDTPPRSHLYQTQTPQVFRKSLYLEAMDFAMEHSLDFTDDCQLVEATGCKVCMTMGDYKNIKITTPEDIHIAEVLLP